MFFIYSYGNTGEVLLMQMKKILFFKADLFPLKSYCFMCSYFQVILLMPQS